MPSKPKTLTDKLIAASLDIAREKNINVTVDFDGPSTIVTLTASNKRTSFSVYEQTNRPQVTHMETGHGFRYTLHDRIRKEVERVIQ